MSWNEFIGISSLLYALANPIGVVPIFLGFTARITGAQTLSIIASASLAVFGFLLVTVPFGQQILDFFNVSLDDFRIAGGLMALFIAFEMFQAHYGEFMQTAEEHEEAEANVHGIAITPLAFPLLVGPAEIGVMITLANDAADWSYRLALIGAAALNAVLVAVTLLLAGPISRIMGQTGINVATRVMALIVAAIGVNFIVTGVQNHFPGLVG
jgi:multiple antibiotic resistance protein